MYIADYDTFRIGGASYSEELVSSPFVWDNQNTNGHNTDDT